MKKINILVLFLLCSYGLYGSAYSLDKEEENFYIATKAFNDSFFDASASLFKRFVDDFPQSKRISEANLYIAKCYYFKQDYPKALKILEELSNKKESRDILDEAYYWLAQAYTKGKNFKNAVLYAQKIITNFPNSKFYWWAYDSMAKSYVYLDDKKAARETLEKIINDCKESELAEGAYEELLDLLYLHKENSDTIERAQAYVKRYPRGGFLSKAYLYLGDGLMTQKEYDKAIGYFNKALDVSRNTDLNDTIYQGLSYAFLAKENTEEAKNIISKIQSDESRSYSWGMYYFTTKEYTNALEAFNAFVAKYPQSNFITNVYLNKANTLYEMGRINDSLSAYRTILDNFKNREDSDVNDKAHYGLAWCYLRNGEFKKAIEEFKNTLKFTDNAMVKISSQIQIADVYQESENYAQALDLYNEVLKNSPNTVYADYIQFQIGMIFLKTKKIEESFLAFRNLSKNFPSSKLIPQAQYYLAVGYFSTDSYSEARKLLEEFSQKYPQHDLGPKVKYLYGKCFFNEKEYAKAADVLRNLIGKIKDKEVEAFVYIDLGNTYLNMSEFDKAKGVWEEFLGKYPQSQLAGSVALNLGGLYEKEENFSEAQKYYTNVVDNYAKSIWADQALFSLGDLCWRRGDLNKAQEYFTKLSKVDAPIALKSKLYLARIYGQKGDSDGAIKLFNELIESSSSMAKLALLEKAFLLKDTKQYSQAVVMFKKSIDAGLDSARLRFDLASSYEKLDQNKDAIDEFYRVIYTFGDNEYKVKSYFHIAKLYEKLNRLEAAREVYKKIVALNNDESRVAQEKLEELRNR